MPKDEWGVKRLCPQCDTRFYDLKRDPMTCPSCGAVFDLESLLSKKSSSRIDRKEPEAELVDRGDTDDDAVVLDDDEEGADVDLDDDLLDEDEDDNVDLDDIADVPADDDET